MGIVGNWVLHQNYFGGEVYYSIPITFRENGTFVIDNSLGKWTYRDGIIIFRRDGGGSTFTGSVVNCAMVGISEQGDFSVTCTWYAINSKSSSIPLAAADKKKLEEAGISAF